MGLDFSAIRQLFPACAKGAYLMSAGMGPLPTPVLERVTEAYARLSVDGGLMFHSNLELIERCRERVARLLNAPASSIAFTPNVSFSMNALALSLPPEMRARPFVSLASEFPSSVLPWEHAGFKPQLLPVRASASAEALLESMPAQTGVFCASHVQYATGERLDPRAIGPALAERGVAFVLNATQSFGVVPLDVQSSRVSALAATCHKWLFTGEGISVLYVSPEWFGQLRPALVGWRSAKRPFEMRPSGAELHADARVFELGTPNTMAFHALAASLDLVEQIGVSRIAERVEGLSRRLLRGLQRAGFVTSPEDSDAPLAGIVSARPSGDLDALLQGLRARGVYLTRRGDYLRFAVHFFNDESDIDRALRELSRLTTASEQESSHVAAS